MPAIDARNHHARPVLATTCDYVQKSRTPNAQFDRSADCPQADAIASVRCSRL
jgi:hypothetical protein